MKIKLNQKDSVGSVIELVAETRDENDFIICLNACLNSMGAADLTVNYPGGTSKYRFIFERLKAWNSANMK